MKLTLLILSAFLYSSCTFEYFTLSGDHLSKNENNDFVIENDTLKVTYRFSGEKRPISITIYNKTSGPLEVDWKKSALIIDGEAIGYYSPNLFLNGSLEVDSLRRNYSQLSSGNPVYLSDVKANIYVNEPLQFIPPKSFISKVPLSLPLHSIELPSDQLKKESYRSAYHNLNYKKMQYSSEKSPISFRSYLSFHYGGNPDKGFSLDHRFYVSEIWQTGSYPLDFPQELLKRGDFVY